MAGDGFGLIIEVILEVDLQGFDILGFALGVERGFMCKIGIVIFMRKFEY